jgi:hypothetical protein
MKILGNNTPHRDINSLFRDGNYMVGQRVELVQFHVAIVLGIKKSPTMGVTRLAK